MFMTCYGNCKCVTGDTEYYVFNYVDKNITSSHGFKLASQGGLERWLSGEESILI